MTRSPRAALRGAAAPILCALAAAGCGYSLRGTLPAHLTTVGVPIFLNQTVEPGIDGIVTRAVVESFSTNGRLRVVRPEDADAILSGSIVSYSVFPIAYGPNTTIAVYRVTITVNLTFRDVRENTVLWQQTGLTEQSDFRVIGQVAQTIAEEQAALQQAAVELGRNIVALAVNRF